MLLEWLEQVATTCPAHLREMGLLREMMGIRTRWRRYRAAWQPHCDRSRAVVLDAVERCKQRGHAVVIGSGWLHDVPLAQLSAAFERVTLVDLFHPWLTRWTARRYANVRLLAADITGTLEEVFKVAGQAHQPLPTREPTLFLGEAVDLVVSLNLLSQLPCMAEWYLRRAKGHDPAAIVAYCRDVVRGHLAYLKKLPGVVALVTDVSLEWVEANGVRQSGDTLYQCQPPGGGEQWVWELVPYRPGRRGERLQVIGISNIKDLKM